VPVTVANEQEMLQRVASTPGAIGYLANSPGDDRVQVIKVR
jgi:ABC-type phosphate transport system substrate-binding protein